MSLTLYTYPNNYRALKSAIVAKYCDIDVVVPSSDEFKFPDVLKSAEFKKLTPVGKVPVLSTPDGPIFESNAILRYLARSVPRSNLLGRTFYQQAQVDQWLDFTAFELEPPRNLWIYPLQGLMTIDARASKKAKHDLETNMQILNDHLASRTFMVGERVTIADIAIVSTLVECFRRVFDPAARQKYAHVTRWFRTLTNQPYWKDVQGDIKLCEKEEQPPVQGKGKKNKGGNKQQAKKKAKKAEPAAVHAPAPKKKVKNPLDSLPPSKMDLETVKRIFANNKGPEALKQFWEGWDGEGYSLYLASHKDVHTVDWMTSNLAHGFIERLDSLRKYAFGAVCVWGVEDSKGPFYINSAWVFRGKGLPAEFVGCPDVDNEDDEEEGSYIVSEVKLDDAASKKKFEDIVGSAESFEFNGQSEPSFKHRFFM